MWLPVGPASGRLARALERRGVVTRAVGEHGVRVTIGRREENDRFWRRSAVWGPEVCQSQAKE